jgi:ketosteroid isomerase-like protein
MKHSGAKLDAAFCHVYRFRDDRIVSFHQYTDSAQWARLMP